MTRGVHLLPVADLVGLGEPDETRTRMWERRDGVEMDLVTHDLRKDVAGEECLAQIDKFTAGRVDVLDERRVQALQDVGVGAQGQLAEAPPRRTAPPPGRRHASAAC
jgi:hypothetical protein